VAFTNNTVAPDRQREREKNMSQKRKEEVNKPSDNDCVRQTAERREKHIT